MADYNSVFRPRGGKLYNPFEPYVKEASRLIYGADDYSARAKKVLNEMGNAEIKSAKIVRTPVPEYIIELLNVVSFGDFKKRLKETEYDKLFHLAIVFDTTKGRVLVEKNEVINISKDIPPTAEGYEDREVSLSKRTNLNEVLKNTQQKMQDR